ncbi:MAG: ATPase [Micrococcales bacterium]|nr:ATPase [Micrococcales bacterium]MCL2666676.1 ATPase [Micrococcales bacterium]
MTATYLPEVRGVIERDGTLTLRVGDEPATVLGPAEGSKNLYDARRQLVAAVAAVAHQGGHERVVAHVDDPESGAMMVAVTAGGSIEDVVVAPVARPTHVGRRSSPPAEPSRPAQPLAPTTSLPAQPSTPRPAQEWVPTARPVQPVHRPPAPRPVVSADRRSVHRAPEPEPSVLTRAPVTTRTPVPTFLVTEPVADPARTGWRGRANRVGLNLGPTGSEVSLRRSVRIVSQHWPGLRTVAVANAKGSACKTPTTIGLAAAFARHGGGGVAAVDNNPTRGTLPWRTEQGPHDASVTDLLPHVERLMNSDASASQLAAFLHHQTEDRYDVLRSKPERLGPPFTAGEFDAVVRVLAKYYRLLIFDSGNDETSPVWQHMIELATQLVVPTLARREWAEAGRLLLTELSRSSEHGYNLATNAVVIVSQADPRRGLGPALEIARGFEGLVRATAVIPYDPHMVEGHMRWTSLSRATRDAWIHAAAMVATGF